MQLGRKKTCANVSFQAVFQAIGINAKVLPDHTSTWCSEICTAVLLTLLILGRAWAVFNFYNDFPSRSNPTELAPFPDGHAESPNSSGRSNFFSPVH